MEFVKVVMNSPFGSDAYIECYMQLTGNEEEIKYLHSKLKNKKNNDIGFDFCEVYSNDEVDAILRVHAGQYTGHADNEQYVKLEGILHIDMSKKTIKPEETEKWWESMVQYAKWPKFENIADKVVDSKIYKSKKQKYDPKKYPVMK